MVSLSRVLPPRGGGTSFLEEGTNFRAFFKESNQNVKISKSTATVLEKIFPWSPGIYFSLSGAVFVKVWVVFWAANFWLLGSRRTKPSLQKIKRHRFTLQKYVGTISPRRQPIRRTNFFVKSFLPKLYLRKVHILYGNPHFLSLTISCGKQWCFLLFSFFLS